MSILSPLGSDTPFIGEIKMVAFTYAPRGWAQCNGQSLPISQNQALFSLLGTTYGGNGVTTFNLPDLRGRLPMHFGTGAGLSTRNLGQTGGEENHTLLLSETPAHTHSISASTLAANQPSASGGVWCENTGAYSTATPDTFMPTNDFATVGGQAHSNQAPYLTVIFCIALVGLFPSQN